MKQLKRVDGGVTAARGYSASGVLARVKPTRTRPDIAMLVSSQTAAIAGVFTTNKIQGAHVTFCKQQLRGRKARALAINAGCANACVGPQGFKDARRMAAVVAEALGVSPKEVFVCSTGTIGIPLPMDRVESGLRQAARELSPNGGPAAANAIMTTDTHDKQCAVELIVDGKPVRIGGMAKGAGMIEPNMATMLSFITTDAAVDAGALQRCLADAVRQSYNRVSVDGDQSCNDTVLLLANGVAENRPLNERHRDWTSFVAAVNTVTLDLALQIARDGEGATRFVTVVVNHAASAGDARKASRAIANSLLVKTAWCGGDPNWGRIIDAVGYSGAQVRESRVDITYDDACAVKGGRLAPGFSLKDLETVVGRKEFTVTVDLHLGKASETVYTCDCSEEYVKINAEYMT